MTTTDAASPEKGEAAVAEGQPEAKTLEWRGVVLALPPTLSTMRLVATWRRLGKAAEAEDGQSTMNYLVDLVDIVLGGDEQQADRVWAQIDADTANGEDAAAAVFDFVDKASDIYGTDLGE